METSQDGEVRAIEACRHADPQDEPGDDMEGEFWRHRQTRLPCSDGD